MRDKEEEGKERPDTRLYVYIKVSCQQMSNCLWLREFYS